MKRLIINAVKFFGIGILSTILCEVLILKIIDRETDSQWILLPFFSCILFAQAAIPSSLIFLVQLFNKSKIAATRLNYAAWVVFSIILYFIHRNTGEKEYRAILIPITAQFFITIYLSNRERHKK